MDEKFLNEVKADVFEILNVSGEYLCNVEDAPTMQEIYDLTKKLLNKVQQKSIMLRNVK